MIEKKNTKKVLEKIPKKEKREKIKH